MIRHTPPPLFSLPPPLPHIFAMMPRAPRQLSMLMPPLMPPCLRRHYAARRKRRDARNMDARCARCCRQPIEGALRDGARH
jgi:hypothetical protein